MTNFDLPILINWLASGFIGFIFGIAGTWVTYRYERMRDDIAWKREKEKLERQFEQDKLLLEIQFQQKLKEIEQQLSQKQSTEIRQELLRGVDNPGKALQELRDSNIIINGSLSGNLTIGNANEIDFWTYLDKKTESPLYSRFQLWMNTPKQVRLAIKILLILSALLSLSLILLVVFVYINP
jgi:hypothetical protein